MPKYYPNTITGEIKEANELWGVSKRDLQERGYDTSLFNPKQYNGHMYFILRKKIGDRYVFEKVSIDGTKNKLPRYLYNGWEVVKSPRNIEA